MNISVVSYVPQTWWWSLNEFWKDMMFELMLEEMTLRRGDVRVDVRRVLTKIPLDFFKENDVEVRIFVNR